MFEDTIISSEDGKSITWTGIIKTNVFLSEQKYLVHDKSRVLKFIIDKRNLVVNEAESSLFFIFDPNLQEQTHARITENKYSQLLISTITHDLKSPITAIKGNLDILENYIATEGKDYLLAAQISTKIFEYYIYDLIVFFDNYYRIIA